MPTYDYECRFCQHHFEHFQSMKDKVLRKCPECGRQGLQRLIGPGAGIVFKGSGFYETDYRSEGYKSSAKKDSSSPATSSDASKGKGKESGGDSADKGKKKS